MRDRVDLPSDGDRLRLCRKTREKRSREIDPIIAVMEDAAFMVLGDGFFGYRFNPGQSEPSQEGVKS